MAVTVPLLGQGMTMSTVSFGHQMHPCTTRLAFRPVQRVNIRTSAGVIVSEANAATRKVEAREWIDNWRSLSQNGVEKKAPAAKASKAPPAVASKPFPGGNGKVSNGQPDSDGYILYTEDMLKKDSLDS